MYSFFKRKFTLKSKLIIYCVYNIYRNKMYDNSTQEWEEMKNTVGISSFIQ